MDQDLDLVGAMLLRLRAQVGSVYNLMKNKLTTSLTVIISYRRFKRQNHLKVGTDKPTLKVKMQSVSDDDIRKRLLEKPHSELVYTTAYPVSL